MKTGVHLILLAIIITGCNTTTNQECTTDECLKQQAYDRVIAVHDAVMPKMANLSKLKSRIEERMNATHDSTTIAEWQQLMEELDRANEAMWVWMRQFNANLEEMPVAGALAYLKEEQDKVDAVAKEINEVIARAEKRLEK
jgi:predicted RNase H-like nuclease